MAAKKKATKRPAAKKQASAGPCRAVNQKSDCRPTPKPCPTTVAQLCKEMREYMICMCEWGVDVVDKIQQLKLRVDGCCGGPGPNGVPKPPPPPF